MKKTALLLIFITLTAKVLGLVKDMVLSYFYGASAITDAYMIAITIPGVVFSFIVMGLKLGYIPMHFKILERDGPSTALDFTNNLINHLILISTGLLILGLFFTRELVILFASGFEGDLLAMTVKFTRISLVSIYFIGINTIFKGYLHIQGRFYLSGMTGVPENLIMILSILLSATLGPEYLLVGFVLGKGFQILFLTPQLKLSQYRYRWLLRTRDPDLRRLAVISIPVILGVSANQINVLIDRTLASRILIGGISALSYSHRLTNFFHHIFVLSITTVIFPEISKKASALNYEGLIKTFQKAVTSINLIIIPASIGAMIFSEPIIRLIYGRGSFDREAVALTSASLLFYALGMTGIAHKQILSRIFYGLQETRIPMINTTIGVSLNILLNLILSKIMGIPGLALATSLSAMFTATLLSWSLKQRLGGLGLKKVLKSTVKILFASILMGVLARFSYEVMLLRLTLDSHLILLTAILVGVLSYGAMIYVLKIPEITSFFRDLQEKLRSKGGPSSES